jgi:hypothetical protein
MNYLSRALVLGDSLQQFTSSLPFIVVCHDDETINVAEIHKSPNTILVHLQDIVLKYPELKSAISDRTKIEFLYALTPFLMKYTLEVLNFKRCVYVDADECFFSNPDVILEEPGDSEFAITGHNFPSRLRYLETRGKYNVGIVYAKSGHHSTLILSWWAKQCIISTSIDMSNNSVFGDQKYLDYFNTLYSGTHVYADAGINAAPWNLSGRGFLSKPHVRIPERIVCFHFSGLIIGKYLYLAGFHKYRNFLPKDNRNVIFEPYVRKLLRMDSQLGLRKDPRMHISIRNFLRGVIFRDLHFLVRRNGKN